MFTRNDLENLAAYEGQYPVVSLYLHLDPRLRSKAPDAYQARLKTLLKKIDATAPPALISSIDTFFEREFDWAGRSVALFADQDRAMWHVEQFEVPLRSLIHLGHKPFISPLADLLNTYGDYTVILVEQQAVRMIHFRFGALVAEESVEGEDVKRLKSGGGASGGTGAAHRGGSALGAHNRQVVSRNLKSFAEQTIRFCTRLGSRNLLLSGTDTTIAQFENLLPQMWQERVIGNLTLAIQTPENEIRRKSLEAIEAHQQACERALVDQIVTEAARQGMGILGIEDTLEAIHAGRVQTLALVDGFHTPGYNCPNCGFATIEDVAECPYCSITLQDVPDIIEHAISRVVDQGGEVIIVDPGTKLADIGALLRY